MFRLTFNSGYPVDMPYIPVPTNKEYYDERTGVKISLSLDDGLKSIEIEDGECLLTWNEGKYDARIITEEGLTGYRVTVATPTCLPLDVRAVRERVVSGLKGSDMPAYFGERVLEVIDGYKVVA